MATPFARSQIRARHQNLCKALDIVAFSLVLSGILVLNYIDKLGYENSLTAMM